MKCLHMGYIQPRYGDTPKESLGLLKAYHLAMATIRKVNLNHRIDS